MSRMLTAAFPAALLLSTATLLSACNTGAGAGQDVSNAGKDVTHAADQH